MSAHFIRSLLVLLCLARATWASDPLDTALSEQRAADTQAVVSQQRVEALDDEARRMLAAYRQAQRDLQRLKTENDQRERRNRSQADELARIGKETGQLRDASGEIEPLMARMLSVLERFVALDLPFLPEEREARLAELRGVMGRPDVDLPERYRRLLEAYQVEFGYGRDIEAYRGSLRGSDPQRLVEFLHLGRVALYYLSLNGEEAGTWDPVERRWIPLDKRYHRDLARAIRIARKEQPPDLMVLPLFAPGGRQAP